jgi:hypothetical protein
MELIVAALATWQIVEIWHHSLLMAPLRSRTEMWDNKLGELLVCPFCLSVWIGLFCTAGLYCAYLGTPAQVLSVVIHAFAVSRLANLGNDYFKPCCLTPKAGADFGEWVDSMFTEQFEQTDSSSLPGELDD